MARCPYIVVRYERNRKPGFCLECNGFLVLDEIIAIVRYGGTREDWARVHQQCVDDSSPAQEQNPEEEPFTRPVRETSLSFSYPEGKDGSIEVEITGKRGKWTVCINGKSIYRTKYYEYANGVAEFIYNLAGVTGFNGRPTIGD